MTNPSYNALLITNARFDADPHNLPELMGPRNDSVILGHAICDNEVGLFDPSNVQFLREGTDSEIRKAIEGLFIDASSRDTVLLYYSGHGRLDLQGQLYLCASNTRSDRLRSTAVGSNWISEVIDGSAAAVTMIFLDCCHSGAFKGGDAAERLSGQGRFVLAGTRAKDLAMDSNTRDGASFFTAALTEGIRCAHDSDGDGLVTLDDLYNYIYRRLRSSGNQVPHKRFSGDGSPPISRRAVTRAADRQIDGLNAGDPRQQVLGQHKLRQVSRRPKWMAGVAAVALFFAYIGTASQLHWLPFTPHPSAPHPSNPHTASYTMQVGTCVDLPQLIPIGNASAGSASGPGVVDAVDCGIAHEAELYEIQHAGAPASSPYPGTNKLSNESETWCKNDLSILNFMRSTDGKSTLTGLQTYAVWPSSNSWAAHDTQEYCFFKAPWGQTLTDGLPGVG